VTGVRSLALAAALACGMAGASAGTASARFSVGIVLQGMPAGAGSCVNRALGNALGAIVKVDCDSNQFVSIEPDPGRPFLGSMSGIRRIWFGLAPHAAAARAELLEQDQDSSLSIAPGLVRVTYEATVATEAAGLNLDGPQTPSVSLYKKVFGSRLGPGPMGGMPAAERHGTPVQMLIGF
jgi:hypothetical protein